MVGPIDRNYSSNRVDLTGDPVRRRRERIVRLVFFASAGFSIIISIAIVVSLFGEALSFVSQIELTQLWDDGWFPRRGRFDVRTIFTHSLIITAIAMVVAIPLGLGSAIYLSEYATSGIRRVVKPTLEVLAGIPSVVLGFFALTFITPDVLQRIFNEAQIFNMAAAGIGVGILTTPLIASISEDSLRAVPGSLREASYGLGARKVHTTLRVVVPAAVSGVVASFIVGVSRAIGETMVVAIAAGASGGSLLTLNPLDGGQTMTGAMASLAIGSDQVAGNDAAFQSLFFVGLLLFLITLALNVASERFVRRVRTRY